MDENVQQPEQQAEVPGASPWAALDALILSDKAARDLAHRFTYHPPVGDQPERYVRIRKFGLELAIQIALLTPPSREQSLALTHLEDAVFWANASIARRKE